MPADRRNIQSARGAPLPVEPHRAGGLVGDDDGLPRGSRGGSGDGATLTARGGGFIVGRMLFRPCARHDVGAFAIEGHRGSVMSAVPAAIRVDPLHAADARFGTSQRLMLPGLLWPGEAGVTPCSGSGARSPVAGTSAGEGRRPCRTRGLPRSDPRRDRRSALVLQRLPFAGEPAGSLIAREDRRTWSRSS